jgi:hypothetical protein
MKNLLFSTVIILGFTSTLTAQYDNAIGLRFGLPSGVTYKKFISADHALEGILHLGSGIGATAMYQIYASAFNVPNLRWYYGYGAHVHIMSGKNNNIPYRFGRNDNENNSLDLGINGVIGLDYKFENAPINLSIDATPMIGFNSSGYTYFGTGTSLGLRFTF